MEAKEEQNRNQNWSKVASAALDDQRGLKLHSETLDALGTIAPRTLNGPWAKTMQPRDVFMYTGV